MFWFRYSSLQRTRCFDFYNILEENCGADIINRRMKCKSFAQNSAKKVFWFSYTFVQRTLSLDFLSFLEENCGANIINRRIKCKRFLQNAVKNVFWFSYTFLQRTRSLDFLSFLEENCGADIINRRIECNSFVENAAKRSFGSAILSHKERVLWTFSAFWKKVVVSTSIAQHLNVRLFSQILCEFATTYLREHECFSSKSFEKSSN